MTNHKSLVAEDEELRHWCRIELDSEIIWKTENFLTLQSTYPPGALKLEALWQKGWQIAVQPIEAIKEPNRWPWITTYKRRDI